MVLNGNHKGEKCLIKEEHCTAFDGGQAQEFWKEYEEQLVSCQDTKVIRIDETDFFVEIYVKNPQRWSCVSACGKNRQNAWFSCDSYG